MTKLNEALRQTLAAAYRCPAFDGVCKGEMTWNPQVGHVPRGYCGAEGRIEDVQLVLVFAEPGNPYEGDRHSPSPNAIEETMAFTRDCFKNGTDLFHRNVRFVLDQCWPGLSFDEQMKRTWLTESVLCSAKVEGGNVNPRCAVECRTRYFEQQIALMPSAVIMTLGSKAKQRLRGIPNVVNVFAAAPPGCNQSGARPSWIEAAESFRRGLGSVKSPSSKSEKPLKNVAELPGAAVSFIRSLESAGGFQIDSLKMQTTIHYKGIKVGGLNRTNKHFYIAQGVARDNPDFEKQLLTLRFVKKTKPQSNCGIYVWWQIPASEVSSMQTAIEGAKRLIDNGKVG